MKIVSSYKIKIQHYNNIFSGTVEIYRRAVAFFIDVCDKHWQAIQELTAKKRNNYVESLTIKTIKNPNVKYDFSVNFHKMPSYLRRAAIQQAIGAYSSYTSNLANWENGDKKGKKPTLTTARNVMPTFYKDNCYIRTSTNTCKVKIFHKNDWIWLNINLREQDVKYIDKNCTLSRELVPTLKRQGKMWFLTFPFEANVKLADVPINQKNICAVDLGLNNNAVCSIMQSDGTVVARKFINLATEKDHLQKALNRQKKVQKKGNKKTPIKWQHANDLNTDISRKTAKNIMDFATLHKADTIVFEYLDMQGRKKGSKKQRLHLWRKREIQKMVEHKAHKLGMRINRVNAWNTSRLAYDGSGRVERGEYEIDGVKKYNYSICVFASKKVYNCDLNASYNLGSRYFIREILKSDPVMARLPNETKVFRFGTGTTRTLSTLIRLNAELAA